MRWLSGLQALVLSGLLTATALGQAAAEKKKPLEREELSLTTRDGLDLKATYYPSPLTGNKAKDAVPVIMLHMHKGKRSDYDGLAKYMQSLGHAVIVPDLRGHGQSTKIKLPNGREEEIDSARLKKTDVERMVQFDVEAVKSFLMSKNNEKQLNIEKLCVIGAEMGATVAALWAAQDWSWPALTTGKQGQDVKALVLISPQVNFRGVPIRPAMDHPDVRSKLSILLMSGKGTPGDLRDAQLIKNSVIRFHPDLPPDERAEKQDFFFYVLDTSLVGTKMLTVPKVAIVEPKSAPSSLAEIIAGFINLRLTKKSFPWTERTSPL